MLFHSQHKFSALLKVMPPLVRHCSGSSLQAGLVGLPNVGKSTLFNALTSSVNAQAANYPFCTIDANVGTVMVPDERLEKLAEINNSEKVQPTTLKFVDIAGLVAGASEGEDQDVVHVIEGKTDPVRDASIINSELILSDLSQIEKRKAKSKRQKAGPCELAALDKIQASLEDGIPVRSVVSKLSIEELKSIEHLGLLTQKQMIYAAIRDPIGEDDEADIAAAENIKSLTELAENENAGLVEVCAQLESEIIDMTEDERNEFLCSAGYSSGQSGLSKLIHETYTMLKLRTFYTSGPTETRAWTIRAGTRAPAAAGVIHGDFERGFIRAETISYDDCVGKCGPGNSVWESGGDTLAAAKELGLMRSEGRDYIVKCGDVMLFRFNV